MSGLQEYHWVWLRLHPNRSVEWLQERMKDGFDIHHIDGDHLNNDGRNLILVECLDHMRLHGRELNRIVRNVRIKRSLKKAKLQTVTKAAIHRGVAMELSSIRHERFNSNPLGKVCKVCSQVVDCSRKTMRVGGIDPGRVSVVMVPHLLSTGEKCPGKIDPFTGKGRGKVRIYFPK